MTACLNSTREIKILIANDKLLVQVLGYVNQLSDIVKLLQSCY